MKIVVYNDIHCGSSIELMSLDEMDRSILNDLADDNEVISLGDNLDLAGCEPFKVEELKQFRHKVRTSYDIEYIDGNHERMGWEDQTAYYVRGRALFAHGDIEKWGIDRAKKYRFKKHGAGWLKRKLVIPVIEWAEQFGVNRATKKFKERVVERANRFECHTYICGHIHPKEKLDFKYKGIRIIVLPRGRNEVTA